MFDAERNVRSRNKIALHRGENRGEKKISPWREFIRVEGTREYETPTINYACYVPRQNYASKLPFSSSTPVLMFEQHRVLPYTLHLKQVFDVREINFQISFPKSSCTPLHSPFPYDRANMRGRTNRDTALTQHNKLKGILCQKLAASKWKRFGRSKMEVEKREPRVWKRCDPSLERAFVAHVQLRDRNRGKNYRSSIIDCLWIQNSSLNGPNCE